MTGRKRFAGAGDHAAFIEALLGARGDISVLASMSPQQPTASISRFLHRALERDVHVTLWVADLNGRFEFLDPELEDALRTGRLVIGAYAGGVPRRLASLVRGLDLTLWETDRAIAGRELAVDLCLVRAEGDASNPSFGRAIGILPTAMSLDIPVGVEFTMTRTGSPPAVTADGVWKNALFWLDDRAMPAVPHEVRPADPVRSRIAELTASLIPIGADLQVGIGSLAEEVVDALGVDRNVHFHSGTLPLAARDLIRAQEGQQRPPHVATSVAPGEAIEWPSNVTLRPLSETHDPRALASLPRLWAVNSGLTVDLAGSVNAEWIGVDRIARGGGHLDFARAASRGAGGASVITLPSRTGRGASRIVAPAEGAPRPTTGGEFVDFIVTEWGIADVRGVASEDRGPIVLEVAHPDDRKSLSAATT